VTGKAWFCVKQAPPCESIFSGLTFTNVCTHFYSYTLRPTLSQFHGHFLSYRMGFRIRRLFFTIKVMDSNLNGQIWCRIPRERSCSRLSLSPWFFLLVLLIVINNTDVTGFRVSRTTRSQPGHHAFSQSRVAGSRVDDGCDLESLVAQAVTQGPYLLETTDNDHSPLIAVDKNIRWTCDNIVAIDGRENYRSLSQQWNETAMTDLAESRYSCCTTGQIRLSVIFHTQ